MKIHTMVMSSPEHFDVAYAINPHMLDKDGRLNTIDRPKAKRQWQHLKETFERLNFKVHVLPSQPQLYDFVFCANTFFAWEKNGQRHAILSNMMSPKRAAEVDVARQWLMQEGFILHTVPAELMFESMGDLIWNLPSSTLFMGHGFRTKPQVIDYIAKILPFPIVPLQLVSEHFYHLDTCFFTLNDDTAAYVPQAFTPEAIASIKSHFKHALIIEQEEALDNFAGNAFCPNGRDVILHPGAHQLGAQLKQRGFHIHEVDTSEFIKSGGSVFCLKNFIATEE